MNNSFSDILPLVKKARRPFMVVMTMAAMMAPLYARTNTSLTGTWNFKFGDEPATTVQVPHTWNPTDAADGASKEDPSAFSVQNPTSYKRGVGVYKRELPIKVQAGKRYFLRFEGASIVSDLKVNGKEVGIHEGAFGAFCYEVTKELNAKGANTIELSVDNTFKPYIVPLAGDFSMFGGLYRPAEVIETDEVCIKPDYHACPGVLLTTKELTAKEAQVEVNTLLSAKVKQATKAIVSISIKNNQSGKVVAKVSQKMNFTPKVEDYISTATVKIVSPELWDGRKNPALYTVSVQVKTENGQVDTVKQQMGLRTISIDPKKGFVLNGKAIQLKGVNRHQDKEGKGWAISREDEDLDIKLIKNMGADAIRTAHYPQTDHIYDLCDESGIVVWSEVSCIERVRDDEKFIANVKQQAQEMILQHYNHPSIAMWGIFNEIYHQNNKDDKKVDMIAVLKMLNAYVKEQDPTRMTVAASNQPGNRALNTIPDTIGFNCYPGWYGGGPDGMNGTLSSLSNNYAQQGVAISEYGHGAGIHTHQNVLKQPKPVSNFHPEEWQSHAHAINYKHIKSHPEVWGTFIWNMFDFGSDCRREGEKSGMNDKGLVTYDRKTCKDAYYFYKANWNSAPMVYITSRRFVDRKEAKTTVKVYANKGDVELFLNGKSLGVKSPSDLKEVTWDVELKEGKNTLVAKSGSLKDSVIWNYVAE